MYLRSFDVSHLIQKRLRPAGAESCFLSVTRGSAALHYWLYSVAPSGHMRFCFLALRYDYEVVRVARILAHTVWIAAHLSTLILKVHLPMC